MRFTCGDWMVGWENDIILIGFFSSFLSKFDLEYHQCQSVWTQTIFVGPDLGSNLLQKLSAEDIIEEKYPKSYMR